MSDAPHIGRVIIFLRAVILEPKFFVGAPFFFSGVMHEYETNTNNRGV